MNSITQKNDKNEEIFHLHHLIEFELEKTQTESIAVKKDMLGIILLIFGFCGLLVYIPIDLFLYNLFPIGLFFLIGYSLLFIFASHNLIKEDNIDFIIEKTVIRNFPKTDFQTKLSNLFKESYLSQTIPILTVFFDVLFCYFTTISIVYFLSIFAFNTPLFSIDYVIFVLLVLQGLAIVWIYKNFGFLKKKIEKRENFSFITFAIPSIILLIGSLGLFLYGVIFHIPPFTKIITNSSFSPELVASAQTHNEFFIIFPIFSYLMIVFIVILDFVIAQQLSVQIDKKIQDLNGIKSKIDLYLIGSSKKNIDKLAILKEYLKAKRFSVKVYCFAGMFWLYLPSSTISKDEVSEFIDMLMPQHEFEENYQ